MESDTCSEVRKDAGYILIGQFAVPGNQADDVIPLGCCCQPCSVAASSSTSPILASAELT